MHPKIGERRVLKHVADVAKLDQRDKEQVALRGVLDVEQLGDRNMLVGGGEQLGATRANVRVDLRRERLMLRHVGGEDRLDHCFAHGRALGRRQRRQHVRLALRHDFERRRAMMILQHRYVVVEHGQRRFGGDEERVVDARMRHVVTDARQQQRQLVDRSQRLANAVQTDATEHCVRHVERVRKVVIRIWKIRQLYSEQKRSQLRERKKNTRVNLLSSGNRIT
jgi:hypothetical protein